MPGRNTARGGVGNESTGLYGVKSVSGLKRALLLWAKKASWHERLLLVKKMLLGVKRVEQILNYHAPTSSTKMADSKGTRICMVRPPASSYPLQQKHIS